MTQSVPGAGRLVPGVCLVVRPPGLVVPLGDPAPGDPLSGAGSRLLQQPAVQFCDCTDLPHHAVFTSGMDCCLLHAFMSWGVAFFKCKTSEKGPFQ